MAENMDTQVDQERIHFNIGGQHFETLKTTLQSFPSTRISDLSLADPSYCSEKKEYFFDRNPSLFPFILDLFRNGELAFPASTPASSIRSELEFWGIDEDMLSASCMMSCSEEKNRKNALLMLNKTSNLEDGEGRGRCHALWMFLEEPCSSVKAMVWSAFYILMILITVAAISTETLPQFQVYFIVTGTGPPIMDPKANHDFEFGIFLFIFATFFLIELFARFAVCPKKLRFFTSVFNYIDVLAIIPMFIVGAIIVAKRQYWDENYRAFFIICLAISILRAIRILKLGQKIPSFRIICLAFKASLKELLFLMLMLVVGILVFSTILYRTEASSPTTYFTSIPGTFWYCIITMTTVGYGDSVPMSPIGKFIGGICALSGILVIVMSIPIILYNYQLFKICNVHDGNGRKRSQRNPLKPMFV